MFIGAAVTAYHRLGGENDRQVVLTVLEAGKSKIKVLTDLVLGEALFLASRQHLLAVSSHGGSRGVSSSS